MGFGSFLKGTPQVFRLYLRLLLIIFVVELAIDGMLHLLLPPLPGTVQSLVEGLAVTLCSATLIWGLFILPLRRHHAGTSRYVTLVPLLLQLMTLIFALELVSTALLPEGLKHAGLHIRLLADAFLLIAIGSPLIWWLLAGFLRRRRLAVSMIPEPFIILYRMVVVLFSIEFVVMAVMELAMHPKSGWDTAVIDAALLGLFSCPFIWWLVVQPIRRAFSAEKARFELVVEQVVDAVVVMDQHGRIELFNSAAELAFGYREEDVRGQLPDMLVEEPAGYVRDILAQAPSGILPADCVHHEVIGRRRDGSRFPMSISVSKADLGDRSSLILIIRDISPIKEHELRQQRMLSLLEATLEATADAILAVDWQRRITTYNQRMVELFRIPADMLAKRDTPSLLQYAQGLMEDPEGFLARVEELYRLPDATSLDILRLKDGRIIERSSHPQLLNGQSIGRVWSYRDITDRSRAEEELRRSEERFRALATNAPVGIFETDAAGRCIFVNDQWCSITGVFPEQVIDEGWESALHPDDREVVRNGWYESVLAGRQFSGEYRFCTPEGQTHWVYGSATSLRDYSGDITGYLGVIIDITDRKQALLALSDSEKRFREIFEQTEDAIVLLAGGQWTVLDVNPTAEALFGCSKEELVGRPLTVFRHGADRVAFQESVATLPWKGVVRMDRVPAVRKDGTGIHVSIHGKLIQLQGERAVYCTFRDVTERIRLEEEAHAIQSRLIMANKMTSLGLLVAGVAHEINNPNNYILGNAQLLERVWRDLDEKLLQFADEHGSFMAGGLDITQLHAEIPGMLAGVIDGSRRIRDIINNLKNYSRQGVLPADSPVDLNRVISLAMALLNHHINRLTDRFHLELTEAIPVVMGSPQQLEQVVVNLVMNALQSLESKDRGVWVTTAYDSVRREVSMTVRDEGAGIPAELLERVYEPFFTTRLDSGGTGLGLSITSSIVAAHGGSMTITSQPLEGTTVTIALPVAVPAAGIRTAGDLSRAVETQGAMGRQAR